MRLMAYSAASRGSFGFHSFAAVEDGEVVVRGEIVRIDGLQRLELRHGIVGPVLLVVGDAELAARIAGLRILRDDFFEIGDSQLRDAFAALDERQIVERAGIVRMQLPALSPAAGALSSISPIRCRSGRD